MFFKRLPIIYRLLIGFGLLVLVSGFLVTFSIVRIQQIKSSGNDLYNHPFTVSKAIRDINTQFKDIHLLAKEAITAESADTVIDRKNKANQLDLIIQEKMKVINERFLGEQSMVDSLELFIGQASYARNTIMDFLITGNKEEAISFNDNDPRADAVQRVYLLIDDFIEFIDNKAIEFRQEGIMLEQNSIRILFISSICLIILSLLIVFLITQSITKPLSILVKGMNEISKGNMNYEIREKQGGEPGKLILFFKSMQKSLLIKLRLVKEVAGGNYMHEIPLQSNQDELGIALNKMTRSLKQAKENDDKEIWIRKGRNQVNDVIINERELKPLTSELTSELCSYIGGHIAALYLYEKEKECLKLYASYAWDKRKAIKKIMPGENIAGQAAIEEDIMVHSNIPQNTMHINSATGKLAPKNILAASIRHNKNLLAVIEIGSFHPFEQKHIDFIESVRESIASAIESVQYQSNIKTVEQKIKGTEYEMEQIFHILPVPVRVIDNQCNVISVNEEFLNLIGKYRDEVIGKKCYNVIPGKHCSEEKCPAKAFIDKPEEDYRVIAEEIINGEQKRFEIHAKPLVDQDGELIKVIETFQLMHE